MELFWDPEDISPNYIWSFSEFLDQYNELYEWLVQFQLKLYSHSNPPDTRVQIDQQHLQHLQHHEYRLKLFAFQGEKVAERFSLSKEEIFWRVRYLTNKWVQLQNIFAPSRGFIQDTIIEVDLAQEETFLRKWLEAMEEQIKPITCKLPKGCSLNTLKERYKDNQILLKDVKAHGPILKNIIRQYENQSKYSSKIAQNSVEGSVIQSNVAKGKVNRWQGISIVPRKIKGLEKKWHQIYLRSLEWHYHLEGVIRNFKIENQICRISDSDDEPVSKCRRISAPTNSCELPYNKLYSSGWSDYEYSSSETGSYIEDDYVMTDSNFDGKKSAFSSNKNSFSNKTNVQLFTRHTNKESTNGSGTVSEMNSFVFNSENSEKSSVKYYNESMKDENNCIYNSNTIINANSSDLSQVSKLTDMSMETPNCGVFDYKHDSDSESNKNNLLVSSLHRNNKEYFFDKTKSNKGNKFSCKNLKNKDVYEDEEQEQKNLQHIIDSAVLDHDWLDGNITFTDSDESVVEKAESFHIDEKIEFENSKEKRKFLSIETIPCNKKFIHQLVKDAENLVREPIKFQGLITQKQYLENSEKLNEGKQCQIKNWLNSQCNISRSVTQLDAKNNNMQDSCDASGELTTGESDFESKESDYEGCDTSLATEKGNEQILHCASNTSSTTEIHFDGVKQKVIRGKKRHAERPRSANIIFENAERLLPWDNSKYVISSSETALDQMGKLNLKQRISSDTLYSVIPNESVVNQNKNVFQASPSLTSGNNCRRRRIKQRKKYSQSLNLKMDSDLDETLCKTGRKSEVKCLNNYSPSHTPTKIISSDSDNISFCSKFRKTFSPSGKSCLSRIVMTSSTEKFHSDSSMVSVDIPSCLESRKVISQPVENIAATSGPNFRSHRVNLSDQETTTQPEDASSLSEQAWDSYQEYKYLSEPYSEDVDVDAERKLIEFGDDYSKYIDSDGSSFYNIPNRRRRSSFQRRVRNICSNFSDSDSEIENIPKDIEESQYKLDSMEKSLNEQLNCILVGFNWDEFITTAKSNTKYLQDIIRLNSEGEKPKLDINIIYNIVNKWELLEAKAKEKQLQSIQVSRFQWQLKSIRMTMENILNSCSVYVLDSGLESFSQISNNLDKIKSLINECDGLKSDISALNTQIHVYSSEIAPTISPLKDEISELYRIWDETYRRVQSELSRMEQIEVTFRAWEEQKVELSRALKQDSDALKMVNAAVDNGKLTESVTASVHDVAKLLNERRKYTFVVQNKDQFVYQDIYQKTHLRKKEDHLSDSGTSGYESCSSDDLSERERRLAYLIRLARDLEASLAPGCSALKEINSTLDQAEKELKDLQDHCRYLILKTTESFEPNSKNIFFSPNSKRRILAREGKNFSRNSRREKRLKILGSRRDWIWRVARAAAPFQIALMLLVCVACLLEPNCCDSVNTYNLSFTPQLRFVHGSPPV